MLAKSKNTWSEPESVSLILGLAENVTHVDIIEYQVSIDLSIDLWFEILSIAGEQRKCYMLISNSERYCWFIINYV